MIVITAVDYEKVRDVLLLDSAVAIAYLHLCEMIVAASHSCTS